MTFAYKNRVPYLYLEYGSLKAKGSSVVFDTSDAEIDVPVVRLGSILLGPGTSATHAAIRKCVESGAVIQWVGEEGSSSYAVSEPLAGDPHRLIQQAAVSVDASKRAKAVAYMYNRRFGEVLASGLDENTVRGMEGSRVKAVYQKLATEHNLVWSGRKTGQGNWNQVDGLNQAISIANNHLTQVATIAILAAGYSPAIGFLHTGFNKAYSCDISDLYKFDVSVPLAFSLHAANTKDIRKAIRHEIRDTVSKQNLLDKMINDSIEVVDAGFRRSQSK